LQYSNNFRTDIQGLRGIAVLLVVLYHLDLPQLAGGYIGVDVFFVISGYLITGHLIESLDSGRFTFIDFYARRIRRILPASLFVLSCTMAMSCLLMPPLLIPKILKESIATALYFPNVYYAQQQTDYLAETSLSPLLHYWSLGVEEQFYFMWPLLLFICRGLLGNKKNLIIAILIILLAASFIVNLYLTHASQPWAFFLVFTRAWELGAGGLLAFLLKQQNNKNQSALIATVAGWGGTITLGCCAIFYNEHTAFPGVAAVLPVFGATLMLYAGAISSASSSLNKILAHKPLQYFGAISYSLYLWHWPVIILAEEIWPNFSGAHAMVILFSASVLLAGLTYRYVEQPFRNNSSRVYLPAIPALVASAIGAISISLAAAVYGYQVKSMKLYTEQMAAEYEPQANPVFTDYVPKNLVPDLRNVSQSVSAIYNDGCHDNTFSEDAIGCAFGDVNASRTFVLFGDSHAAQWFPALEKYSSEQGIRLITFTKSACPAVDVKVLRQGVEYSSCHEWRKKAFEKINRLNPEVVIVSNFHGAKAQIIAEDTLNEWGKGLKRLFASIPATAKTVVINDTPGFARTPALCLSKNIHSAHACVQPKGQLLDSELAALEEKITLESNQYYLDMNSYLCTPKECGPIIGNLLVYRDQHHITADFSQKLSNVLGDAIKNKLRSRLAKNH
jgi:peptidoglycan/LPS O-acetylase OafA/YrhL